VRRGRPPYPDVLTPREQEVLALIREGLTNEQIGVRLGISEHGAKYHVAEILSKLGVSSRQEAARWAQPQRVAPGLLGLLGRHAAVGALVVAGVGLIALVAGVLLMNERSGGATTGSNQAQQQEQHLPPPPGVDDGPIRRIAYVDVKGDEADIWTMNPDGSDKVQLTSEPGQEFGPQWSPDGRQILYGTRPSYDSNDGTISVMYADGSNKRVVWDDPGGAVWSPDGTRIVFDSAMLGNKNLFLLNLDGSGFKVLTNDNYINLSARWLPDGKSIVFMNGLGANLMNVDTGQRQLLPGVSRGGYPGPDGSHIVARSESPTESGITVSNFDGSVQMSLTTESRVSAVALSPDGGQLAYFEASDASDGFDTWRLKIATVDGSPDRTILDETNYLVHYPQLEWTPDGKWLVYQRRESVRRFVGRVQICYLSPNGTQHECFAPWFADNEDGPTSPSLLLN
jgi:Tol biopolymer transport system component/DNA-binding CsgD family transcriptional regulator